jgi:hypothetical protein
MFKRGGMSIYEYLHQQREDSPAWLGRFNPGDQFPRDQFFASRVVYYPGSGTDGHPVKVFGSTHSAHCFVYADYGVNQATLEEELGDPRYGFRGYETLARVQLREQDLVPRGWTAHVDRTEVPHHRHWFATVAAAPFGFLEVLERNRELGDDHGAPRLAILFLGADGAATYDALFCQRDSVSAPFALVLQDHGFGGNYDRFGAGGLLERIARRCEVMPQWLLVADDMRPWDGFERVPNVNGDRGGMHNNLRFLYQRLHEPRAQQR